MNPRMIVRTRLMPKLFILVLDDTKKMVYKLLFLFGKYSSRFLHLSHDKDYVNKFK